VRKRVEADRVGGDREASVAPSTVVRRRTGGWVILSFGLVLLLHGASWVGTPPWPEEDGVVCGEEAAVTLALRPLVDTSAAVRDLAVEDTVFGGAMAALGVAMVVWWWLRRRSSGEDLASDVILSFGLLLVLLGALIVGTPYSSEEGGVVCADEAALTLALRPPADTSAAVRDLAVEDTVFGGAMAALGVAMVVWWWLRRRSSGADLASDGGRPAGSASPVSCCPSPTCSKPA
jgi:hypothetical protein